METNESGTTKPSGFSARDIAELAVRFLPPLYLEEEDDWKQISPEKLQRRLNAEFTPGGSVLMSEIEEVELGEEKLFNPIARPSTFEVLAEAAVERAKILLEVAAGRKRPECWKNEEESHEQRQRFGAEDEPCKGMIEYQKKFGKRDEVTLEEAAEAILSRHSENVRDALIAKWIGLSEEEREEHNFYNHPKIYLQGGVTIHDYADLDANLRLCAKVYGDAIRKQISRKSGKKGGKKSQAKTKYSQAVEPTADPSMPTRTPTRGG